MGKNTCCKVSSTMLLGGSQKSKNDSQKNFLGVVFRIFTTVTIFFMNYGDFIKLVEIKN